MIRYALTCSNDHSFESWFQSFDAYTALKDGGHLSCTQCGSTDVSRALMAPQVRTRTSDQDVPSLSEPETNTDTALAKMRKDVEDNSDYVGPSFAKEARAMHDGTTPERAIYGEANLSEARKLIQDGVPVAPLPFIPKRKAN